MDRFFSFLFRNKSVFSFKNRSRTGKTDDFSSPGRVTLGLWPFIISMETGPLYSTKTIADIFEKLGSNIKHYQLILRE